MRRLALLGIIAATLTACGAPPDTTATTQTSTADLLKQLTNGQTASPDPKVNEANARKLPQLLSAQNNALARIQSGEDPLKVSADFQHQTEAITK